VEFRFSRASRSIVATSALALLTSMVSPSIATAQATSQQPAAGQTGQAGQAGQQPQKNYKDRGEYDLYSKITQTTDPKQRLELLNTWQDKYPQSDFAQERLQYFVATLAQLAPSDPSQRQPLINKCEELLKMDPKNFTAMYYVALFGPQIAATNPPPELVSQVQSAAHGILENADTTFAPDKKKPNMTEEQWTKAKNAVLAIAHNSLAWAAIANKDNPTAENEYKASLEANPDQGTISYQYGKLLQDDKSVPDDKKYPTVLFEYARAAEYTGPGPSIPPASQPQLMDYFKKVYTQYHGSTEGEDQLLAQAKTNALPPPNLNITSAAALANQQAEATNQRIASDPGFKIWYAIKQSLTDRGDAFFDSDVKGFEIPGEAVPNKAFTGTVISIEPPDRPTKVVLGVEDPTKPDATLVFSQPLPASALDKIKVGQKLDFSGVAESYTKDPYSLTFKDPTIPGVQTTAPTRKGRARHR
jgi:hypothetical protein